MALIAALIVAIALLFAFLLAVQVLINDLAAYRVPAEYVELVPTPCIVCGKGCTAAERARCTSAAIR